MTSPTVTLNKREEAMLPRARLTGVWSVIRGLISNPISLFGLIVLIVIVVFALAGPSLAPHDPTLQSLRLRLRPPVWEVGAEPGYILGTDNLGRDVFSRIIYGARVSLIVGIASVMLQGLIGVTAGLVAGYLGGWIDNVIMRIADVQQSLPFLILAVAVAAVLDASLLNVIFVLGFTGWVTYGRVIRSQALSLREREFVEAARALGSGSGTILIRHILPNVLPSVTVIGTLTVSTMILAEASLSYLGLGVPPPNVTWGGMVADGRGYLSTGWWVSVLPGIALFLTVFSINVVGDRLRELVDPKLRGRSL
jgi:peptide/nickel transport system permease protein